MENPAHPSLNDDVLEPRIGPSASAISKTTASAQRRSSPSSRGRQSVLVFFPTMREIGVSAMDVQRDSCGGATNGSLDAELRRRVGFSSSKRSTSPRYRVSWPGRGRSACSRHTETAPYS